MKGIREVLKDKKNSMSVADLLNPRPLHIDLSIHSVSADEYFDINCPNSLPSV